MTANEVLANVPGPANNTVSKPKRFSLRLAKGQSIKSFMSEWKVVEKASSCGE